MASSSDDGPLRQRECSDAHEVCAVFAERSTRSGRSRSAIQPALAQLYSKEKYVDYLQTAREYMKITSDDAEVIRCLGEIHIRMNRFNEAVVIMTDLHADKRTQAIHELLVKCYLQLRRPKDAVYELKLLAHKLEKANAREDVIEDVWSRAYKIDPKDPEVKAAVEGSKPIISSSAMEVVSASILQPVAALDDVLLTPAPQPPPAIPQASTQSSQQNRAMRLSNDFSRALMCYRNGDLQNAALICQQIISEDEQHLPSLRLLGELYEGVKDWYSLAQVERKLAKATYRENLEEGIRHVLRAEQCTPGAWENFNLLRVFGVDPTRYGLVQPDANQANLPHGNYPPVQATSQAAQQVRRVPSVSIPAAQVPPAQPVPSVRRIPSVSIPAAPVPVAQPVPSVRRIPSVNIPAAQVPVAQPAPSVRRIPSVNIPAAQIPAAPPIPRRTADSRSTADSFGFAVFACIGRESHCSSHSGRTSCSTADSRCTADSFDIVLFCGTADSKSSACVSVALSGFDACGSAFAELLSWCFKSRNLGEPDSHSCEPTWNGRGIRWHFASRFVGRGSTHQRRQSTRFGTRCRALARFTNCVHRKKRRTGCRAFQALPTEDWRIMRRFQDSAHRPCLRLLTLQGRSSSIDVRLAKFRLRWPIFLVKSSLISENSNS